MTPPKPKVALVTGSASGIGRATALALHGAGYRVFGTSRRPAADPPSGIEMLTCDVTDNTSVMALVDAVLRAAGRIDLLVNNAGIGLFAAAEETPLADAQALFDVNLFGVIRVTNAVLPTMRLQRVGRIVNLSSVQGFVPVPFYALYAASKHAIEGYSQSLDHELRTLGIRVSVVEPGFTRTAFDDNLLRPGPAIADYGPLRRQMAAAVADEIAKGEGPEVVAACVLRAATDPRPALRYAAGRAARQVSLLRRFAPAAAFDRSLRRMFHLPA